MRNFSPRPPIRAASRIPHDLDRLSTQSPASADLRTSLDDTARLYGYVGVYLLDRDARVVGQSSRSVPVSPRLVEISRTVARTGTLRIDLLGDAPEKTLISFSAPVFPGSGTAEGVRSTGELLGVGLLVMDASQTLFPILTREGVPTRTGETLLVRREGDAVVFFSPLRHVPADSPNLRFPLPTAPLPARTALEGRDTFVECHDYRSVPVLAATRYITLTGWGMVRKVDRAEALEDFRRMASVEGLAAGFLIILLGSLVVFHRRHVLTRALKQQEEKFRALLESAPDTMVIADRKGRIVLVNAHAEKIFSFERKELVGQALGMLFPEWAGVQPGESGPGDFSRVVAQHGGKTLEIRGLRRDGTQFPAEVRLSPIETVEGVLFSCGIRDVTERKRVEEELRRVARALRTASYCSQALVRAQSEQKLLESVCKNLVEVGGYRMAWVGYAEHDEAKTVRPVAHAGFEEGYLALARISWADDPWGRGPTGSAIRSRLPAVIRSTESDATFSLWREEAAKRGYASSIGLPLQPGSHVLGALSIYASEPDAFDDEEVKLLSELAGDLAFGIEAIRARVDRIRAEAALRQQAALFDQAYDAVLVWDVHGPITFWNVGAERLYGIPREEALGRACQDLLHTTPPGGVEAFLQALEREGRWEGELEHRGRDGRRIIVETRIVVIRDAEGAHVLETNRDITERKQVQEALARRSEELERSNADLEQFAYVASHDLKEPLRAVTSFVQLLQRRYEGKLDAQADEFIAYAIDGASRMQKLIDDLLAFSRVGTRGGEFQSVDCEKAMHAALQNLTVAIQESGAGVTAEALPTVHADVTQLVSLFQNLIGNALKFHGAKPPRIHVSAQRHGAYWQLSVRDNGIGIEPRHFDRVFGIFQRLHTRQEYPGTGIGLAICKKIVARHGGKIWLESESGKGTTFYFTLPVRHHASDHRPKTHSGG